MICKENVERIALEWLEGKDYFLVDVIIDDQNVIKIEIDHQDGVWIDDCVELSHFVEDRLSREEEDYELEVGSAGLGQPFKVLRQYQCHIGQRVEVLPKEGTKMEGELKSADEESFTLTIEKKVRLEGQKRPKMVQEDVTFHYDEIKYTKYVISFK